MLQGFGLRRIAYWAAPPLIALALYWRGLFTFFQQDDFAWLGLHLEMRGWQDLPRLIFSARAQGTIRPWSERLFFLVFQALFGLDPLPYRIWVFLTLFVAMALLTGATWQMTKSRAAGFWAPVIWTAGVGVAAALSWTAAYNQILCSAFLLGAFCYLQRYLETGETRYNRRQWVVFLLGFGALETNVVYPVLAAAYTWWRDRRYLPQVLWLFVPSLAYAALHAAVAPTAGGVYAPHLDASILQTLATYWTWALGSGWAAAVLTIAAAGFTIWKGAWFPLAWFVVVLLPVLPLRDHRMEYYLATASLGVAMLGAWAMVPAWRWAAIPVLIMLAVSLPHSLAVSRWYYERGRDVENLLGGVEDVHRQHPGKVILLAGVNDRLFWASFPHFPFRLLPVPSVYLVPGAEQHLRTNRDAARDFIFPARIAALALERGEALVYDASSERLKNVTSVYRAVARERWSSEPPWRVDAGDPLFAGQLGEGWHPEEGGYRWMGKQATVRLAAPRGTGERLNIVTYCPAPLVRAAPLRMTVSAGGAALGTALLDRGDARFDLSFALPGKLAGKGEFEVAIEVDRTFIRPKTGRESGAAFGTFEVR